MLWAATATRRSWTDDRPQRFVLPWPSVAEWVAPMGGQHMMLLSAPGVGKTTFALNAAAYSGAATLFLSMDTDARLVTEQLAALATGEDRATIRRRLARPLWQESYARAIRRMFPHLVLDFPTAPEVGDVADRAEAVTEVWGTTPDLIVLDVASNLARQGDDYGSWQQLWSDIQRLSRVFGSTLLVAHHVKEGPAAGGTVAPSLNDGQYKPHQFAEIVLGLHAPSPAEVTVTVLKNRGGRKDLRFGLVADLAHAQLRDPLASLESDEDLEGALA